MKQRKKKLKKKTKNKQLSLNSAKTCSTNLACFVATIYRGENERFNIQSFFTIFHFFFSV